MKKTIIPILATLLVSSSLAAAELDVYGSLNYKLSNDDNASGENGKVIDEMKAA